MKTKFKVKADAYQFLLYQAGDDLPEPVGDDPADAMKGYKCVGHYATIDSMLHGVRNHLLKSKTKKARDLEAFLKVVVSLQQELKDEIQKQSFLARKIRGPKPEVSA